MHPSRPRAGHALKVTPALRARHRPRAPRRACAPASSAATRARGSPRGATMRSGGRATRSARTSQAPPAGGQDTNATSIGNRIPTVWTDRQRRQQQRPAGRPVRLSHGQAREPRRGGTPRPTHRATGRRAFGAAPKGVDSKRRISSQGPSRPKIFLEAAAGGLGAGAGAGRRYRWVCKPPVRPSRRSRTHT